LANDLFSDDRDDPGLRETERIILQAAAMHYAPIGRTRLAETVRKLGVRAPGGKTVFSPELRPFIERLLQEGALEDTGQGVRCPRERVEPLLDEAMADGRLPALAAAVRASINVPRDWYGRLSYRLYDELVRDLRIALIESNGDQAQELLGLAFSGYLTAAERHPLLQVDSRGHRAPWIAQLSPALYQSVLLTLATSALVRMEVPEGLRE
jgi:hypothetical protein